jgi:TRAP-type uncharacterized transport system fused permease subunit
MSEFSKEAAAPETWFDCLAAGLAVGIGLFVFYTSYFGSFETLIQRAVFVAMIVSLSVLLFPLGRGKSWRPLGAIIDVAISVFVVASASYIVLNFERIMNNLPFAEQIDVILGFGTLLIILEMARRSASFVFPLIVGGVVAYAYFGDNIPGVFGHRGFGADYLTEVIFCPIGVFGGCWFP